MVKNLLANTGDIRHPGSIPRRSPGEGNGNPLQCSWLQSEFQCPQFPHRRSLSVPGSSPEHPMAFLSHVSWVCFGQWQLLSLSVFFYDFECWEVLTKYLAERPPTWVLEMFFWCLLWVYRFMGRIPQRLHALLSTLYQGVCDIHTYILGDIKLHHLIKVLFVSFLQCKVITSPLTSSVLCKQVTKSSPA